MLNILTIKEITNLCKGKYIMITALLIMAMAVNGGLYAGTIAYSAYKSADFEKSITLIR